MAFVRSVCTHCERVAILREKGALVILGFTVCLTCFAFPPPARTILSWAGRPQNNSAAEGVLRDRCAPIGPSTWYSIARRP